MRKSLNYFCLFIVANNIQYRSSSAWSSASGATPPPPNKTAVFSDFKLPKNDLSNRSNVNFANFANEFENTTGDLFLDKTNNNNSAVNSNNVKINSDLFSDFNDNFEIAVPKKDTKSGLDPFGMASSSRGNGAGSNFAAAFDDDPFGDSVSPRIENNTRGAPKKVKNSNINNNDKNQKYSADYSKNFDTDLEEVLKRSLVDQ